MTLAVPASLSKVRRLPRAGLLIPLVVAFAIVAGLVAWKLFKPVAAVPGDAFFTVAPMDLDIVIRKDGELQSVKNLDVTCPVEGLNTIRTIVPEGSFAKKGDVIAELDASEMKKRLQTALLDVQKADSAYDAAKVAVDLQKSKNVADLDGANVELKTAQIDLKAYTEGTYPQSLRAAQRDVEMAKITVQDNQQLLNDAKVLQEKGFGASSDVRKAQVELIKAQSDLDKKEIDLKVLADYTHEKDLADKENKLAQAQKKVQRTITENESSLAEKVSDMQAKEQSLVVYKQTLEHTQEQVDACTIKAPGDGVVIYGSTVQTYYFRDTPIQPGGKIAEQQLLIRLPDTSNMKVVAKIAEALAMKLRAAKDPSQFKATVQIVGIKEAVPASVTTVAILPDNSNRWWDPDRKEYPVDLTLSSTPAGLKPGVTSRVEIVLDHLSQVLAAPLATIYSEGDDRFVFVRRGNDVKPQKVTVGQTTDTHAQVLSGVNAGDQILILEAGQGRQLLEKAGIKASSTKPSTTQPSTQPAAFAMPATQPTSQPSTQPAQVALEMPATRPSTTNPTNPSTQPTTQPVARL
jgi:multidrug resistance efflux pump